MNETTSETALNDRVVIVTGGASGIGQAVCIAAARAGARVVVVDLAQERVDAVVEDLNHVQSSSTPGHLGLALDVRSEGDMETMAQRTLAEFGRIDVLVASAGILRAGGSSPKPLVDTSVKEWDDVVDTNLKGLFLSNRAVLPAMIKQRSGDIVNVSSVSGKQGRANDAPYCASKFGVIGVSESLAEEVRSYGIRVQLVIPDAVDTPIWQQNGPVPAPPDALPAERVAELILYVLTQPADTMLVGPIIAPVRTRRRRKKKKPISEVV